MAASDVKRKHDSKDHKMTIPADDTPLGHKPGQSQQEASCDPRKQTRAVLRKAEKERTSDGNTPLSELMETRCPEDHDGRWLRRRNGAEAAKREGTTDSRKKKFKDVQRTGIHINTDRYNTDKSKARMTRAGGSNYFSEHHPRTNRSAATRSPSPHHHSPRRDATSGIVEVQDHHKESDQGKKHAARDCDYHRRRSTTSPVRRNFKLPAPKKSLVKGQERGRLMDVPYRDGHHQKNGTTSPEATGKTRKSSRRLGKYDSGRDGNHPKKSSSKQGSGDTSKKPRGKHVSSVKKNDGDIMQQANGESGERKNKTRNILNSKQRSRSQSFFGRTNSWWRNKKRRGHYQQKKANGTNMLQTSTKQSTNDVFSRDTVLDAPTIKARNINRASSPSSNNVAWRNRGKVPDQKTRMMHEKRSVKKQLPQQIAISKQKKANKDKSSSPQVNEKQAKKQIAKKKQRTGRNKRVNCSRRPTRNDSSSYSSDSSESKGNSLSNGIGEAFGDLLVFPNMLLGEMDPKTTMLSTSVMILKALSDECVSSAQRALEEEKATQSFLTCTGGEVAKESKETCT